jgi:hypothetical protein
VSFEVEGIGVTATGHHAEHDSSTDTTTIYGPFPTAPAVETASFSYPGFGRVTAFFPAGTIASGLVLQADADLGQTNSDQFQGGFHYGIDNILCGSSTSLPGRCIDPQPLPSTQFVLLEFSAAVDVSTVTVESINNFNGDTWVAGCETAPDLSLDLLEAFADCSFRNSTDDGSSPFTHTLSPLEGIRYLAVGAAPNVNQVGDLGPISGVDANVQFSLEGLNVSTSASPVPALSSSALLVCSGLLAILGVRHARRIFC